MNYKTFFLALTAFISINAYSQDRIKNINVAYRIAFGISPDVKEVTRLNTDKQLDFSSLKKTIQYFDKVIFNNRETLQRDIIRRAYLNVLKRKPTEPEVEDYYITTSVKVKNFTELSGELKSYFKLEIEYPE